MNITDISTATLQSISALQAWHYRIIPFENNGNGMHFYVSEGNNNVEIIEELEMLFGTTIHLESTTDENIRRALNQYYPKPQQTRTKQAETLNQSGDFLIKLIEEASGLRSSDIHLELYENTGRIRFRIDGKLVERYQLKKEDYPGLVNKIKIKANLDIAEKRLPQDGRIFFKNAESKFDIRVSSLPTLYGEKVVMRLLSTDHANIEINSLGFIAEELDYYLESIKKPNGIVLISGPTGSGKTTTLYATLQLLNKTSRNILTIEDPIEYTLEGINQVQLKEAIGLDFASAMRTFLRQDPDIIMLGEIRDKATASMAIRASLTGHLVLSTIHTNSAWGIVARLIDMGIPPYLLADTLNATIAQRLVRKLCPDCKKKTPFDKKELPRNYKLPEPMEFHYTSEGCEACLFTGYKGRRAVYEVIGVDETLAHHIKEKDLNVKSILKEKNYASLSDNAFMVFKEGITSLEEVYPILSANHY
ncbi:MAG: type II/IV secretion system protein [Bacteroidetes bacterium]|nr:MAG: type II/IV secretion system protein [Bacteroidota bacterium]